MKALKLLFFADRFHLRKYGRPVSDCTYFAMRHGPVASEAKNVAEESARLDNRSRSYVRNFIRKDDQYHFKSIAEVDEAVLSKTDREALDFSWTNFGHYSEFRLRNITHHYPEWKRQAGRLGPGRRRAEMVFADFFEEPGLGYNPCHKLSAKERQIGREVYLDSQTASECWK